MASIGGFFSGGLNLLDLPGSMARDLFAGENPFDQLANPFGETGRQMRTGRDLARRWGWAGPENTWSNLLGGMALEVATDPTTWLSGGLLGAAKLLGPASKAARAARIASKAVDPVGTAVGAGVGQLAKRFARYPTLQAMAHADLPPIESGRPWLRKEILARSAKEPAPRIGYTPAIASQETVPRIGHTPYAPPFYSRLERAVEKLSGKPIKANPQRLLKTLKAAAGREGFSEKEIEFRRLMDALEGKQTVTKADLMAHLKATPLTLERHQFSDEITDVVLSRRLPDGGGYQFIGRYPTREAAQQARDKIGLLPSAVKIQRVIKSPRYPEFTMPGGRNLTEDLLVHPPEQAGYTYRSGHYEDVPNWVTEVVTKEYDLPGGRVGKIAQEIQSDQMERIAKTAGVRAEYVKAMDNEIEHLDKFLAIRKELASQVEAQLPINQMTIRNQLTELDDAIEISQDAIRALKNNLKEFVVPGSPFEHEWQNLGIKDLIRQTAESPTATHFGWLTGEDQARWAAGAGTDPSERVLQGLQQHADVVLPQKAQKIAGGPMQRVEEALQTVPPLKNDPMEWASYMAQSLGTPDETSALSETAEMLDISRDDARALGQAYTAWMPQGTNESQAAYQRLLTMVDTARSRLIPGWTSRPAWLRQMSPELRHKALYEGFPYMTVAGAAPLGAAAMYAALEGRRQPAYQESF